jgi:hypothetical protein
MKPDFGLLQRISDKLRTADDEYRRRYPYRFADRDILFIENVASMLGCSVDHVRRIERSKLPASRGVGRRLLYLREDVLRYVRSHREAHDHPTHLRDVSGPRGAAEVTTLFDAAAAAKRIRTKAAG